MTGSLRWRITRSLWLALGAVGLLCSGIDYWAAWRHAGAVIDQQMAQIAGVLARQQLGAPAMAGAMTLDADDGYAVAIRDRNGALLFDSQPGRTLPTTNAKGFGEVRNRDGTYRIYGLTTAAGEVINVGQLLEERDEVALASALAALAPVALLVPVLGLMIGLVIRRQLRPLGLLATEITRRLPGAPEPLPLTGLPDELHPLIRAVNRLLGMLGQALLHEQRFVTDAAHALRTPLTALQLQAAVLDGSADPVERARRLAELDAGIRRVARLSADLLAVAPDDSKMFAPSPSLALDDELTELVELYQPAAQARALRIELTTGEGCRVAAHRRQLRLLIGNPLENALRYSESGGCVSVTCVRDGGHARITIVDEGPGLDEAELAAVFDWFYRAPGDTTAGSGLGLSTARRIASDLGGVISLHNRDRGRGLQVLIRLPLWEPAPGATADAAGGRNPRARRLAVPEERSA